MPTWSRIVTFWLEAADGCPTSMRGAAACAYADTQVNAAMQVATISFRICALRINALCLRLACWLDAAGRLSLGQVPATRSAAAPASAARPWRILHSQQGGRSGPACPWPEKLGYGCLHPALCPRSSATDL